MATDPQIRVVVAGLKAATEQVMRRLTLDITANLLASPDRGGTPVDTGWARANWVPSVGRPIEGVPEIRSPEPADVSNAAARQAQGQAELIGYRLELGDIFISNNVPYIINLNDGSSKQAPKGFVENAVLKAVAGLR